MLSTAEGGGKMLSSAAGAACSRLLLMRRCMLLLMLYSHFGTTYIDSNNYFVERLEMFWHAHFLLMQDNCVEL